MLITTEDAYDVISKHYHHTTEIQSMMLEEALNSVPEAGIDDIIEYCRKYGMALLSLEMWEAVKEKLNDNTENSVGNNNS